MAGPATGNGMKTIKLIFKTDSRLTWQVVFLCKFGS